MGLDLLLHRSDHAHRAGSNVRRAQVLSQGHFITTILISVVATTLAPVSYGRMAPRRLLAYLDPKRNTPTRDIWLTGVVAYSGTLFISYEQAAL